MKRILAAGATGYLGRFIVQELHRRGYWVRALARSRQKLNGLEDDIDHVFLGEVTKPDSIEGITDGVDAVISSVGITRQKDNLSYLDVDYQGNLNLLNDALKHNVKKFIYVSVLDAQKMMNLKIVQAKERFVNALQNSPLAWTVIRPNGFFSDMREFLDMAEKGRVYLFGDGQYRANPIHGKDLAKVCVDMVESKEQEIDVGGPIIYTHLEIAEAAFKAAGREPKIFRIPVFIPRALLPVLRLCAPLKVYGPVEFFLTVLTRDMVAPKYGEEDLTDFFFQEAKKIKNATAAPGSNSPKKPEG